MFFFSLARLHRCVFDSLPLPPLTWKIKLSGHASRWGHVAWLLLFLLCLLSVHLDRAVEEGYRLVYRSYLTFFYTSLYQPTLPPSLPLSLSLFGMFMCAYSFTSAVRSCLSKKRKKGMDASFYCSTCNVHFTDMYSAEAHKASLKHQKRSGELALYEKQYKKDEDVTVEDVAALVARTGAALGLLPWSALRCTEEASDKSVIEAGE